MKAYSTSLVAILATSIIACLPEPESLGITDQELDSSVRFHENFFADGDPGQCKGTVGVQSAAMGTWTSNVLIDSDDRPGGCRQQFGVTDPEGLVSGLALAVNFFGDGDAQQCGDSGLHPIPVTGFTFPSFSSSYRIDTDDRSGGCWQVFSVSGRNDIVLDIQFLPTDNGGQCGNSGLQTATSQRNASFRINTDNRSGGCTERFRLRRTSCGDQSCDANENRTTCPIDCERCGDSVCGIGEPGVCGFDCPVCGDDVCGINEPGVCNSDCPVCGDGVCGQNEDFMCPADCNNCGAFICEPE
jgi:hypothetical protein